MKLDKELFWAFYVAIIAAFVTATAFSLGLFAVLIWWSGV